MALTSIYFRAACCHLHPHHSGHHIHYHKFNVSCFFLPFDPFFDFICDKNRLTTSAVKLSSSYSNSETLNFVRLLCCLLLSSSNEPLAVVELKAHLSQCQSFEYPGEYPCVHEVVVDLKVKGKPGWCWRENIVSLRTREHNKVQQVAKRPEQA